MLSISHVVFYLKIVIVPFFIYCSRVSVLYQINLKTTNIYYREISEVPANVFGFSENEP